MKRLQIATLLIVAFCATYGFAQLRNNSRSKALNTEGIQWAGHGKFLFLSDVHLDPLLSRTTQFRVQDAGMDVWSSFMWKVDQLMQAPGPPEFVIYTGDLPVHGGMVCQPLNSSEEHIHDSAMTMVLNKLKYIANRYGVRVFYLPGNNDALNGDYLPFAEANGQTALSQITPAPGLYPTNCANAGMISCQPKMGYYSAYAMPGLRVIAMNTVVYNNAGCRYKGQQQECTNQMLWLRQQLSDAAKKNEQCYVAMHIPPGNGYNGAPMWNSNGGNWTDSFLALTAQYSKWIAGIFYGHTHMDEMRLLYAPQADTITEVAMCCPGLSILHDNNPGFKVVTFDRTSKEPVDFTTYYSDIPVVPQSWPKSYSFSGVFGARSGKTIREKMTNLSADSAVAGIAYIYKVRHKGSGNPATINNFYTVKAE